VDSVIPPRGGRRQVLHLMHRMRNRPARAETGATDLGELLRTAYTMAPRRSLIFVVSDFISAPGWAEPLAHLAQRHDVVAVRLYDPLEMELPDLGMLVVQDAETGEQLFVDTHDRGFRRRFEAAAKARAGTSTAEEIRHLREELEAMHARGALPPGLRDLLGELKALHEQTRPPAAGEGAR